MLQINELKGAGVKKRPEISDSTAHVEYFERLMFDRVNLSPLPKIEGLNIIIEFKIVGYNPGSCIIVVEDGVLKRVSSDFCASSEENEASDNVSSNESRRLQTDDSELKPECTFILDGDTFMSIVRREFTPQRAFFQKKVRIEGNVMLALKMNVLVNYL